MISMVVDLIRSGHGATRRWVLVCFHFEIPNTLHDRAIVLDV